ncbi:MAG: HPr family phosphocarrier protein [Lachnospiraceae bacterium]|nr:HPr family phosphocarrier protein [Lachnospiraceae bacterium]
MAKKFYLSLSEVKEFVNITSKCDFDIDVASNNRYYVDAKSIVGVLGLDLSRPLSIVYNGYNEDLESFIKNHAVAC